MTKRQISRLIRREIARQRVNVLHHSEMRLPARNGQPMREMFAQHHADIVARIRDATRNGQPPT